MTRERQNQIQDICRELEEIWLKAPDLRLGQLIENLAHCCHTGADGLTDHACAWSVPDRYFEEAIAAWKKGRP